jgi:hypothetical protein
MSGTADKFQVWWNPHSRVVSARVRCLATYASREKAEAALPKWRDRHPSGTLSVVRALGPRL